MAQAKVARATDVQPAKKARLDAPAVPEASIVLQFQSDDGETVGPQLAVPQSTTPEQLETLLNGLLSEEGQRLPYLFYVQDRPLGESLGEHLLQHQVSVETALAVVYQPQAVFRVRPVTRCAASLSGHAEAVLCVAFSPDGANLASGSGDSTVRLWELSTSTPRHTCQGHKAWVLSVAWSPDARHLASGDMAGTIWLWDPATGSAQGACKGHTKWITSIAWEPAHRQLPCRRFASGSKDATVKVWDAATKHCLFSMSSHSQAISAVLWGGEGLLYSASRDTVINVWDAGDGHLVRVLKGHGHWVNTLALSTEHALRTGPFDHHGKAPKDPAAAQQAAQDRWEAARAGRPERLASGSDDFTMFLWQPSTDAKPLGRMTGHLQLINQVRFSPDGRWLATASFDKGIKLWDGFKGSFVASLRSHVGPVYQLAWSCDSRLLASASKDSTLKVWDVSTRKLVEDLPGHADEVFCVDWSPSGGVVASGAKDALVRLWKR